MDLTEALFLEQRVEEDILPYALKLARGGARAPLKEALLEATTPF